MGEPTNLVSYSLSLLEIPTQVPVGVVLLYLGILKPRLGHNVPKKLVLMVLLLSK